MLLIFTLSETSFLINLQHNFRAGGRGSRRYMNYLPSLGNTQWGVWGSSSQKRCPLPKARIREPCPLPTSTLSPQNLGKLYQRAHKDNVVLLWSLNYTLMVTAKQKIQRLNKKIERNGLHCVGSHQCRSSKHGDPLGSRTSSLAISAMCGSGES